jgi:hypothetical protein
VNVVDDVQPEIQNQNSQNELSEVNKLGRRSMTMVHSKSKQIISSSSESMSLSDSESIKIKPIKKLKSPSLHSSEESDNNSNDSSYINNELELKLMQVQKQLKKCVTNKKLVKYIDRYMSVNNENLMTQILEADKIERKKYIKSK